MRTTNAHTSGRCNGRRGTVGEAWGGGLTRDRTAIVMKNRTLSATARHSTNTNLSACDTGRYPMNRNREREQKTRIKPKQITNDSRHSINVPVSTKPAWAVERMHCSGLLMLVEGRKEGGRGMDDELYITRTLVNVEGRGSCRKKM